MYPRIAGYLVRTQASRVAGNALAPRVVGELPLLHRVIRRGHCPRVTLGQQPRASDARLAENWRTTDESSLLAGSAGRVGQYVVDAHRLVFRPGLRACSACRRRRGYPWPEAVSLSCPLCLKSLTALTRTRVANPKSVACWQIRLPSMGENRL